MALILRNLQLIWLILYPFVRRFPLRKHYPWSIILMTHCFSFLIRLPALPSLLLLPFILPLLLLILIPPLILIILLLIRLLRTPRLTLRAVLRA